MSAIHQVCNVQRFSAALSALSAAPRVVVAYSGGLDSHALLHLLARLRAERGIELRAVHVDHRLHPQSAAWSAHCERTCDALAVPLQVAQADARPARGESPEAAARRVRYAACARLLEPDQELATAHTLDDQAETLLLRLLRGSGVEGAVGIRPRRALGGSWVIRPLLGFRKAALREYAAGEDLAWIEDPSNQALQHDRNFIRQRVMPLLEERWPAAAVTLARDAANFRDAATLVKGLAAADLTAARGGGAGESLSVAALRRLPRVRGAAVLRYWLRESAGVTPSSGQLEQMLDALGARCDRVPCVRLGEVDVRRYRDQLLLVPGSNAAAGLRSPAVPTRAELRAMGLVIPDGARLQVRYRRGGERIVLAGHTHSKSLKKLFQEHAIPPWRRERIPLIFIDGQLAAVPGIGVAAAFSGVRHAAGPRAKPVR